MAATKPSCRSGGVEVAGAEQDGEAGQQQRE